jgi:hypothetical protein
MFRLTSTEPDFFVRPHGLGRFVLSGVVSAFRDPALRFQSSAGDADIPLAQHSGPVDAFRALKRRLPRGVHADSKKHHDGIEIVLQETILPAAGLPFVQIFSSDPHQRVRRIDDNKLELLGATASDCLITLTVDARRTLIGVAKNSSAEVTAQVIAARPPAGYCAHADGAILTLWKDADLRTIAA